jgi:serine protease Do
MIGFLFGIFFQGLSTTCAATNAPPQLNWQASSQSKQARLGVSFAPVIKLVAPSVVNIFSSMTIRERAFPNPFSGDPFPRRFFGDDMEEIPTRERRAQGLGSGVIVSRDGYILTASHVVEGAERVKVGMASGNKEYEAKVIGTDPATDIAVLKVEAGDLPAIPVADTEHLEVGDIVLAIGNPFGFGQTVTMGIVGAVGRGGFELNDYENFIQTDAAINPGNSGGALVDAEGRLVGINTAIFSRTGGNQGVGFAVPFSMARYVMDRIIAEGKVKRGFLGVDIQPLNPELAREFKFPEQSSGALVGEVRPGSAAAKAGIREGDLIMEFNGQKVTDPRTLRLLVAQTAPGGKVPLRILRHDSGNKAVEKNVTVTLMEMPQEFTSDRRRPGPGERVEPSKRDALDGVEVTDLDARTRRRFGIPNDVQGALVASVSPDSEAAEAGVTAGDIIVEINRQPVRNADAAVALSERLTGGQVLLRVWSSGGDGTGGTHYVVVKNPKRN